MRGRGSWPLTAPLGARHKSADHGGGLRAERGAPLTATRKAHRVSRKQADCRRLHRGGRRGPTWSCAITEVTKIAAERLPAAAPPLSSQALRTIFPRKRRGRPAATPTMQPLLSRIALANARNSESACSREARCAGRGSWPSTAPLGARHKSADDGGGLRAEWGAPSTATRKAHRASRKQADPLSPQSTRAPSSASTAHGNLELAEPRIPSPKPDSEAAITRIDWT